MAYRARAFAERLSDRYDIHVAYREGNKIGALLRFGKFLRSTKPHVVYVFDISYSAVLAAFLHRLIHRNFIVVETGDEIYELMCSSGNRRRLGLWLTYWLQELAMKADQIVVRGHFHQDLLKRRGIHAEVICDGVDTHQFFPRDGAELRRRFGVNGELTIGLVGSSVWSEKLQMCYGWELVEVLRLMKDQPVKGIMIGDGSGIAHLKARCRDYEIEDKMIFAGRVAFEDLPAHLGMIDLCLSTQTNDIVGQVRTTGKLPLYLAAGRFVLATRVGEAALVLNDDMLVDYDGVKDVDYPQKLVNRIKRIMDQPDMIQQPSKNTELAQKVFDYSMLADRMKSIIDSAGDLRARGH
jgi:glycosyltransferase involved in cell wall biosynthesis